MDGRLSLAMTLSARLPRLTAYWNAYEAKARHSRLAGGDPQNGNRLPLRVSVCQLRVTGLRPPGRGLRLRRCQRPPLP